jgi:hypothetical protein
MSDPWDKFLIQEEALPAAGPIAPEDPWAKFREPEVQGPPLPPDYKEPNKYTGSVLPFSVGPDGKAQFDSNAGILGSIKRGFMLPGNVAAGRQPMGLPSETEDLSPVADLAGIVVPGARTGTTAKRIVEPGRVERTTNLTRETPGTELAIPGQTAQPGPRVEIHGADTVRYETAPAVRTRPAPPPKPPTSAELQAAYRQGYDKVRDMGVDYAAPRVAEMARGLKLALEKEGMLDNRFSDTHRIIDDLSAPQEGAVAPIAGLESARRALLQVPPHERAAARLAINALDDFYERAAHGGESFVVAGPAAAAAEQQAANRGNFAAFKRSRDLTGIEYATGLRTKATNSGLNLDNNVRGKVTSLLTNEDKVRGYSPEEIAALERVVEGDRVRNSLRFYSNLAGGGGGMGAVVSGAVAGAAGGSVGGVPVVGGLAGAAIPASGVAARVGAGALTKRSLRLADELIRSRSPLYEQMMNDPKMQVISPERRAALVRALLAAGQNSAAQDPSTFNGAP